MMNQSEALNGTRTVIDVRHRGGLGVHSIEFNDGINSVSVYERLKGSIREIAADFSVEQQEGQLRVQHSGTSDEWLESIVPYVATILTDEIVERYESQLMIQKFKKSHALKDRTEQEQVMELMKAILSGERTEIPIGKRVNQRVDALYHCVYRHLQQYSVFQWNPFLNFCIGSYIHYLDDLTAAVLEEYTLEQEYQTIVEQLRSYVESSEPQCTEVHLWYPNQTEFRFCDQSGVEWGLARRTHHTDGTLVFEEGLLPKERIISPIASLAPKRLYVYTDRDDGVILTLRNIFQERINLRAFEQWEFV